MKRYVIKSKVRFLFSVSLIMVIAVSSFFTLMVNAKGENEVTLVPQYVEEGDTLWELSLNYVGNNDIRDYICKVMEINNLQSANIKPGELLYFPCYEN